MESRPRAFEQRAGFDEAGVLGQMPSPALKNGLRHESCVGACIGQRSRIRGSGEMADRVRGHDWTSTPLGEIESWPQELVISVNLMLSCQFPSLIFWGRELIQLYNDPYSPLMGERSPAALGQGVRECWQEVWDIIGPELDAVMRRGETVYRENVLIPITRDGRMQNLYWTYSYSPIHSEDGGVAGVFVVCHETTGELLANQKLRESQEQASRVLLSIGDGVIVTDAESRITVMNPVAEELTGWSAAEAVRRRLEEIFHIFDEEKCAAGDPAVGRIPRAGLSLGLDTSTVLIARDGRRIHIDQRAAPIRNAERGNAGMVLVFRDVSERRAAERERDALTERLNQVLEATTDGVLSLDRNWTMTYLNSKAKEICAPRGDVVGMNAWETFPGQVYEGSPYVYHYKRAMYERIPGEFEAFYPEPLNIWAQIHVRPSAEGVVLFFRDITEEKRAEALLRETAEALRASEEELRWTLRLSAQIPWTADAQGQVDGSSERWQRLTSPGAEQGQGNQWLEVQHPEDVAGMTAAWKHSVETGDLFDFEHRMRMASGEYCWMRSRAYPRMDATGRIVKWYGTTEDVDTRKKAEAALRTTEKLAAVGRLAASIAHEINNPLESVTNLLYLARLSRDTSQVQEYLDTAERELRRVSVISSQTLRFYKQSTNAQPANCEELIESVLSIHHGRIVNSRIEVLLRMRAVSRVMCREGEIRQVLNNLIGNAIDALHPRGGRLLIRSREATHVSSGRRGIALTIADTGTGISRAVMARMFEAFFTTKEIGGTGLGLWVSQEIVERHDGTLKVKSSQKAERSGTVFALFLPLDAIRS